MRGKTAQWRKKERDREGGKEGKGGKRKFRETRRRWGKKGKYGKGKEGRRISEKERKDGKVGVKENVLM